MLPHSQYLSVAPSAYAVLQYSGAPPDAWPLTPTPQPGMVPWGVKEHMAVRQVWDCMEA